jgi:RNA polymerase sigma factor FliA
MTDMVQLDPTADARQEHGPEVTARFNANLNLVSSIVGGLVRDLGVAFRREELLAAGREGLFAAARRFDANRGVPFQAYATYRIRGAILDMLRSTSRLPRRLRERLASVEAVDLVCEGEALFAFNERTNALSDAEAEDYLDEHLASVVTAATAAAQAAFAAPDPVDSLQESPEEAYSQAELLTIIRSALHDLDDLEGKIVELMYFEGLSLEQVSKSLRMSKPWACRLHARAMDRLTKRLKRTL